MLAIETQWTPGLLLRIEHCISCGRWNAFGVKDCKDILQLSEWVEYDDQERTGGLAAVEAAFQNPFGLGSWTKTFTGTAVACLGSVPGALLHFDAFREKLEKKDTANASCREYFSRDSDLEIFRARKKDF